MKKVELIPNVESSCIGFGCSRLGGSIEYSKAKKGVFHALDKGINHFDIARSYGYGQAEKILGQLIKAQRSEIVIATKFGITATFLGQSLRLLAPYLRMLYQMKHSTSDKNNTKQIKTPESKKEQQTNLKTKIGNLFHQRRIITPDLLETSLNKSLKQLGADYVDLLFIHEPLLAIEGMDEIVDKANKLKKSGKLLGLGLAMNKTDLMKHESYLNAVDLVQFDNSPLDDDYEEIKTRFAKLPCVFFSPFKKIHSDRMISHNDCLSTLHQDFPKSVILCSTFNPKHIDDNIKSIDY